MDNLSPPSFSLNFCFNNNVTCLNPLAHPFLSKSCEITGPNLLTQYKTCNSHINEPLPNKERHIFILPGDTHKKTSDFPYGLNVNAETFVPTPKLNPYALPFAPSIDTSLREDVTPEILGKSPYSILQKLRVKNMDRIILGHINLNSIRHKCDMMADLIKGKIDILLISETKIDSTFPTAKFEIHGYSSPYRLDRTISGGGLLLYTREDIPTRLLPSKHFGKIESLILEINISKKKWLLVGIYNPCKSMIANHLMILSKNLEHYQSSYDNIILMGDFNSEYTEHDMADFCCTYNLSSLIKEKTCFKSVENPTCTDLILTNRHQSFQNSSVIETGLSDFHKLTITVLKTTLRKKPPKIISYRNYKKFSQLKFRNDLELFLSGIDLYMISNDDFVTAFMCILNAHAPVKQKYIRANENPFVSKELRKEHMLRSKLRNKFYKEKNDFNFSAYKKQRNRCVSLLRNAKKSFYGNLNPLIVCDNKIFWKKVKPLFSEKVSCPQNITLIENNVIIDDDKVISETFNEFFSNVVTNLNIENNSNFVNNNIEEADPVLKSIRKYENHPSIFKIKEATNILEHFTFQPTNLESAIKEILSLNGSKASPIYSIPVKIMKENYDILGLIVVIDFNSSVAFGTFPNNQKLADVIPIFKALDRFVKYNYRPVSILPALSKIMERLLFYQIEKYMDGKLSMYQCGFRKGMSAQNCLLFMIEKWRKCLDNKGKTGVLLTDLSKAFDCLNHELLIAKLSAYGFDYMSLKLIHSYLSDRLQRVKINSSYSSWWEIIFGVPQGSILGPLLFNIYLSDLFMILNESLIANYADDNSPFACDKNIQLEGDSNTLLEWVKNNGLKANPDKFHIILNGSHEDEFIIVDEYVIQNSKCEKLLGIKIDYELSFDDHVTDLCKKASRKLHALSRISKFMNYKKRRLVMRSFISSQFWYCPLVWMFHNRRLNNRINSIHERSLRLVYDDKVSSCEELLIKDNSFTIHERNVQTLAIELYKVVNGLSPEIMKHVFPLKESIRYPSENILITRNVNSVKYGTGTLAHLGPKIWGIIPNDIKSEPSLNIFKKKIKRWKPDKCPCKLCRTYIGGVGYID